MDPDDHVAAAGEQGHQYHLTNATASDGSGGGSWLRALFRCGWDLTRKVAIVGAAATAAPVVAPPIILASAASLALSVPFAAYLASLTATDRLMAALLPSSPAEPARSYSYSREDDDDVEQEFLDPFQEPNRENPVFYCYSTTDEGATREEDEGVRLTSPPLPRESAIPKAVAQVLVDEVDNVVELVSIQESGHESLISRNGDKIGDGTTMEEKESTVSLTSDVSDFLVPMLGVKGIVVERKEEDGFAIQQLGQDTPVLDRGDKTVESTMMEEKESAREIPPAKEIPPQDFDVSGTAVPIFVDEDNVTTIEVQGDVQVAVEEMADNTDVVTTELVDMHVGIVAIAEPMSDLVAMSEAVVETSYDGEMQETSVMKEDIVGDLCDANIEDTQHHIQRVVCGSVSVASPFAVYHREDVMSSGSTQDVPDICNETFQPDQETGLGYRFMIGGFGANVISGDKHLYTAVQLREELETVRAITGYRSPPSSTLAGELASLYLFVGVEPPVSSRDASDLMEINSKLRLLKSIIGVD